MASPGLVAKIAVLLIVAASGLAQAQSVADDFPGRVDASPIPPARASADPDAAAATAPDWTTDQAAGDGEAGGDDGRRAVMRFGKVAPGGNDAAGRGDAAGDGTWRERRADRFLAAPERQANFDPDAAPRIVPLHLPSTALRQGAKLRQLDKMTGQIQTFDVTVDEVVQVARLRIRLDACRSPSDNDVHGTMAFLKIWDTKYPDADAAFSGWMFAESPALSALDHPRFDVWVINCTTPSAE